MKGRVEVVQETMQPRGVPIKPKRKKFVRLMVHQGNNSALKDVSHMPKKEEFVYDMISKAWNLQRT
jgi:hypothetical protein